MNFKSHMKRTKAKAMGALALTKQLGGFGRGASGTSVRRVYRACVLSIMEYGIEVWHHKLTQSILHEFQMIQNQALRFILGAAHSTPLAALHSEAVLAPLDIRWRTQVRHKTIRQQYRLNIDNAVADLEAAKRTCLRVNRSLLPTGVPKQVKRMTDTAQAPWVPKDDKAPASEATEANDLLKNKMRMHMKTVDDIFVEEFQKWYDGYKTRPHGQPDGALRLSCPSYRALNPHRNMTDKLKYAPVRADFLHLAPRANLAMITQMRTNHLGRYGSPPPCKCGEETTVSHILRECRRRQGARATLAETIQGSLTDINLLENDDNVLALIEFLRTPLES